MDTLVSTEWLAGELGAPDLRIVDASYYLPAAKRDAQAEFLAAHIPGAAFFDVEAIADRSTGLPNMLPSPDFFAERVGALGIGSGDRVVCYADKNMSASARAWYSFRVFGHDRVAVLDGGMHKWRKEGRPVQSGAPAVTPRHFTAQWRPELVRDLAAMRRNVDERREQVVDTRAKARFDGTEPEARPGLRSGHIPGACSLPADKFFAGDDNTMLPPEGLRSLFAGAGIDLGRPIVGT
jgi:thiosulfate/3-mercaptopyruvate sulfurtransferase